MIPPRQAEEEAIRVGAVVMRLEVHARTHARAHTHTETENYTNTCARARTHTQRPGPGQEFSLNYGMAVAGKIEDRNDPNIAK